MGFFMVRTLKITTIAAAAAAVAAIVFLSIFGLKGDKDIEKFLSKPGIAEKMQGTAAQKSDDSSRISPLVVQSKAFSLRINPPPPPKPSAPAASHIKAPPRVRPKSPVAAKFELIGTSFYPTEPSNSWALIKESAKGLHWVRQGGKVGHLTIEKVSDGMVVIKDGSRTYELYAERPPKVSLVKGAKSEQKRPDGQEQRSAELVLQSREPKKVAGRPRTSIYIPQPTQKPPKKVAKPTKETVEKNIEWVQKMITAPEAMGVDKSESNRLEGLGKVLQSLKGQLGELDSNSPDANENTKSDPNEPDGKKKI